MNMDVVWFVCGALRTTKLDWARGQGHAQVRWKLSPPLLRGTLSGRHPLQSPTLVRKRRTLVFFCFNAMNLNLRLHNIEWSFGEVKSAPFL